MKTSQKRYKHAYNKGYNDGLRKQAEGMVSKFRKNFPKIAAAGDQLKKEFDATEATPILPTDSRAIKWEGFTQAMNLIIQSKR